MTSNAAARSQPTLAIEALACGRGDKALFRDFSLKLAPGDVVRVRGANGAGKTTFLRTVAGLLPPLAGRVLWRDRPSRSALAEALCFIDHDNALSAELTPVENLEALMRVMAPGKPADEQTIRQTLKTLGLGRLANRPCGRLSAGQKRRVCLARLWLTDAPLWLLDEPAAALDIDARDALAARVEAHAAAGGLAIYTTHEPLGIARATDVALV